MIFSNGVPNKKDRDLIFETGYGFIRGKSFFNDDLACIGFKLKEKFLLKTLMRVSIFISLVGF